MVFVGLCVDVLLASSRRESCSSDSEGRDQDEVQEKVIIVCSQYKEANV